LIDVATHLSKSKRWADSKRSGAVKADIPNRDNFL
jgi:hypothetical protein